MVTFTAAQTGDALTEAGHAAVRENPGVGAPLLDADEALAELRRCAGGRLDGGLVEALLLALERERADPTEA